MNPFLRSPSAFQRTPVRAERPDPKTSAGGVVTLRLYDPLDSWGEWWGISAKEFVAVLDELPDDTREIRLLINSPGGEVWEALAILNALRAHPAKVIAVVEGVAASSASFIAAGVDELHMMRNAELFVHKAWGMCMGNADDMTKMSGYLEHEDRNIASVYADKAGGTVEQWLDAMAAETWYSADEAAAAGLADVVLDAESEQAQTVQNRFDLSVFNHAGRRATARPGPQDSSAEAEVATGKEGAVPTLKEEIAKSLGIAEDATDEQVLAAVNEALEERADPATGSEGAPVTTEAVTQAAAKFGLTVVDSAKLEQWQADAAAGRAALDRIERQDRERVVDEAVAKGKIPPANREHWLNLLAADPAAKDTLNALPDELAAPITEIGYSGVDPAQPSNVADHATYKNWSL
ncbi:ATP-dependent Clp protease proteolytic subunit [Rhodococcus ruber]|uniref:ATP-dependent Clp protease proteolytic subunit n=1 Tax=Rhodococcus ruber TaxID=1830 RepID=A0A098BVM6_9NOCA|nr:head maturation protease, ClpP-related [Rhodococcus ruber]MCD2127672.1 ATP-dependent Clp protease proteolytic subunit [Rhodococcus ruber]MCZ4504329.1 ATP-dependent Clp protease proteolytic subunit [Rhodococcus ruber]MCZ4529435.1 ATP-dependent Clp protease proteolytic subunit [Rhodococcus ruber]MCZ4620990.1 ATP-dependent Clp protease proteolytic subunit [Rhodococcus ruber]MDI9967014.1 ATP-dependent Clp protease proteolytic subunit [Rhodococcus ruber]